MFHSVPSHSMTTFLRIRCWMAFYWIMNYNFVGAFRPIILNLPIDSCCWNHFQPTMARCYGGNTFQHAKTSLNNNKNSNNIDQKSEPSSQETMNPLTKVSWYAAEFFGKAVGSAKTSKGTLQNDVDFSSLQSPQSLQETLERIQLDNDRSYFLSGQVDTYIYDPNCVFADPFVSFQGRDRFVENLANLGSFITKYNARLLGYEVSQDQTKIQTRVRTMIASFPKKMGSRFVLP